MESKAYREQGLDLKRLVLVVGKKFWCVIIGILAGAVLGGVTYRAVCRIADPLPEYRASADYYITFNFDEFEHGDDYYNAYTWDGILRDDPIVDYALTFLPEDITKEMVKAAVKGEMLGDYRILTVHITSSSTEVANQIASAYQKSLVHFGQEIELLEKIEVWSQEEAVLFEKYTKEGNAAFLGGLLAGLLVLFVLLFRYVLEEAVYVEKDVRQKLGCQVLGIETRKKEDQWQQMLKANLAYKFPGEEIVRWKAEKLPGEQDYSQLRNVKNLVLEVVWGKDNVRQILEVMEQLKLQDCKVKGVIITEADETFLKAYYGKGCWK